MALAFLRPGVPGRQPVGDRSTARSAIFIGVANGLLSPPHLRRCLCGDRPCDGDGYDDVEQKYYLLANFVVTVLGVALLVVGMAPSLAVARSPRWPPAVRWMVWLTKVLACGALQFGVNVLYFCLKMLCARLMLVFA
ncbi:uncharacterized protein LOC120677512 [Panicum virgatum]|uniref:Uncharacterized protein n=1 Tax=Panicum virgatum TaxID=38727 RepID=A0A8T0R0V0_PANVG|nr:uncharacterized protein LOC120677512 [Panicum virgatum]KAG2579202.1 hypothetical protein PVAP13_6NG248206 [Panicum virgatum]